MAIAAEESLRVGVFPRRNAVETSKLFSPMVRHLSETLQRQVTLAVAENFDAFWRGVKNRDYDLVHYNQYHYVRSHKEFGYQVILKNVEFGESTIAGTIMVRKDSGILRAADLKGKSIIFGGSKHAMQSYIISTYLLRLHGLNRGDYVEAFATNPPNALIAAYKGHYAAAGAGDKVLKMDVVTSEIDGSQMRELFRGEPLPSLPWAVKGSMEQALVLRLRDELAGFNQTPQGREILLSAKLDGFVPAEDHEYDVHRRIIKEIFGESY